MTRFPRDLARRASGLAMQLLAVAPLFLLAVCNFAPEARGWALLIPALLGVACLLAGFLPSRPRKLIFPLITVLAAACAFFLIPPSGNGLGIRIVYALLCVALAIVLSLTIARGASVVLIICGLPIHLISGIISGAALFAPVRPLLFPLACADLAALLFFANWRALSDEDVARSQRPARRMRVGNALMCALFVALVFAISQFDRLKSATLAVVRAIAGAIGYLLSLLAFESAPMEGGEGGAPDLFGMAAEETALIWAILEKVMLALCALAALVALALLLRRLPRLIAKLAQKLRALFARYFGALGADYTDETEAISDWGELRQSVSVRIKDALIRLIPKTPWREMDNRQRVRSAYARLSGARDAAPTLTARETLSSLPIRHADPGLFAQSYDKARYSDHPIADEEAENARRAAL